jgi:hypothetical protein
MTTDKYIRIMADYSSTGIWARDGIMLNIEDIPELPFWWIPRLKAWTEKYEDNDDYMEDSQNDFPYEEFAAEGLELALSLATTLADWEIWYFDENEMLKTFPCDELPPVGIEARYLRRVPNGYEL